ncbi:MAG TPA: PA0069 family radical SAM protein [Humisphaera sp.]
MPLTIKGRGAAHNPPNRFERIAFEADPEAADAYLDEDGDEPLPPQTVYLRDASRSIIATNDSPDIPFRQSINPYRGCSHGCVYCFARPGHEYLGFSAGLDFETKVVVKENAPELLRAELSAKRYVPDMLAISGVTDCYQPVERKLQLTRRCLQVCAEFRNPVGIVTKNHLVTRDLDVLAELAAHRCAAVLVSVTTLKPELTQILEPRTSVPKRRLAAIEALANAGVPVGVMVAPVIPGLTDEEVPAILAAAGSAGATFSGTVALRLPLAVAPLFEDWLGRHFPDRKEKVLNRVRAMRGGKLNDGNFGSRFQAKGVMADQVTTMFKLAARRAGVDGKFPELSVAGFRRPAGPQLSLFE